MAKEEIMVLLQQAFLLSVEAQKADSRFQTTASLIKTAIGSINPEEVLKLNTEQGVTGSKRHNFGTQPPVIKGLGKKTGGQGAVKVKSAKTPIEINKDAKFGKGAKELKKGKVLSEEDENLPNIDDFEDPEELLPENNSEGKVNEPEEFKLQLTIDELSKISNHPSGGVIGKLASMSVSEIIESYSAEQLKAISGQIGVTLHPMVKKGQTIAVKILEFISETFQETEETKENEDNSN